MTTQPPEPPDVTPPAPQDPRASADSGTQGNYPATPMTPGEQAAVSGPAPPPGEAPGTSPEMPAAPGQAAVPPESQYVDPGQHPGSPAASSGPQGFPPNVPMTPGEHGAAPPPGQGHGEPGAGGFVPPGAEPPAHIPGYDPKRPIPLPPRTGAPAGSAYAVGPGGGQFNLALPQLGTIVSGPAVGSLVAGIGALFVTLGLLCIGMAQSFLMTIGAVVLSLFCVAAAVLLGVVSLRQVRRGEGEYRGRGMALAGLICGGVAGVLTLVIGVFMVVLSI